MPPRPPGTFTQSVVDGDIIETIVHGRVDDSLVMDSGSRALELMKTQPGRYYYVIDARDASTYDAGTVKAAREIAQVLFKAGVGEIIAITDSGMMRMMGATIAFALSDPISFVSTREEAIAHVRRRRG
jgi:hypothetical protein